MIFRVNGFLFFVLLCTLWVWITCQTSPQETLTREQGLIGAYYGNSDFTNIKEAEILRDLDQNWDEETGHGGSWSGIWEGFLIAPASGKVTLHLSTPRSATFQIGDKPRLGIENGSDSLQTTLEMQKNQSFPIKIWYSHDKTEVGGFRIEWSWADQSRIAVPRENLYFNSQQAQRWNWILEPDPESIDYSRWNTALVEHVIVYQESGRFCGWPANNGIWSWGDEILVGFTLAYYQEKEYHHSVNETKPSYSVLARSLDGGVTWSLEDPENFVGDGGKSKKLTKPLDFTHPDFALRCNQDFIYFSYDRGHSWNGPYIFPKLVDSKMTSRTDYVILSATRCLFLSYQIENR